MWAGLTSPEGLKLLLVSAFKIWGIETAGVSGAVWRRESGNAPLHAHRNLVVHIGNSLFYSSACLHCYCYFIIVCMCVCIYIYIYNSRESGATLEPNPVASAQRIVNRGLDRVAESPLVPHL